MQGRKHDIVATDDACDVGLPIYMGVGARAGAAGRRRPPGRRPPTQVPAATESAYIYTYYIYWNVARTRLS